MKKINYTWQQLETDVVKLALKIAQSDWRPNYIVGVSRGGCVPAVMLSHALNIPMKPLQVSLRDHTESVSDCAMAEDAFGYVPHELRGDSVWDQHRAENILIVDDINDSGATFNWIQSDWPSGCLPDDPRWADVWGQNVRFAVLHNNEASQFTDISFTANYINKAENDVWIVYPWEALSQD